VVVDQLVDRTWGRPDTFHDVGGPAGEPGTVGPVHHQSFADPYDAGCGPRSSTRRARALSVHDGGTMVVINGPRFSTRPRAAGSARWAGTWST
jgi:5'-methylthioadenosine phosphorylase